METISTGDPCLDERVMQWLAWDQVSRCVLLCPTCPPVCGLGVVCLPATDVVSLFASQ